MSHFSFEILKKDPNSMARAGVIHTPHGSFETPAFVVVATKATAKAVPMELLKELNVQVTLANTYHLFLQPGEEIVSKAGGLAEFMNWGGPTFTDSGGFQVFSLGAAFGSNVSKVAKDANNKQGETKQNPNRFAKIDDEGVTFRSHIDGSSHRFTPERSMEIQHKLGADIIFAFDECTSPLATYEYQKQALDRTHAWAQRCITRHEELDPENKQALFGVVQGGQFEDLRKLSAQTLGEMNFDGFGIGGSFTKDDIGTAVKWVNETLPENKPRHLLGIGEPGDLIEGIRNGCDTFDCVIPTRLGRHGNIYTKNEGLINLRNARFKTDFGSLDPDTPSPVSRNYTRAYLSHLFRANEMLGATLASLHNIFFLVELVREERERILQS